MAQTRLSREDCATSTRLHSLSKLLPLSNTLTMAETVFSGVTGDTGVQGTLFQGIKFWISHKVPQRSRFLSDVKVKSSRARALSKSRCLLLRRSMVGKFFLLKSMQMSELWTTQGRKLHQDRTLLHWPLQFLSHWA